MKKKTGEKKEEKMIGKITREQVQATEEEEVGAALVEGNREIMKKETSTKEEAEEALNQEVEEDTEEEDNEVPVGRILLPLPRRCLRLGQEASQPRQ